MSWGWFTTQDQILVPGLTLRGVMSVSGLISDDDIVWQRVVSSFMRALSRCVPTAEMLFEARFYQ